MLSAACPRCGRPAPLSVLAPERLACPACGFVGVPPPVVVHQLRAAAHIMAGSALRDRQLGDAQRRVVRAAGTRTASLSIVLAISLLPAGCMGGCLVWMGSDGVMPMGSALVMGGVPLLVTIVVAVVFALAMRAKRRAIEDACAANPPVVAGAPCSCHVCGAPLPGVAPRTAIARCAHCASDNIVSAPVLDRIARTRAAVLTGYEESMRARIRAMSSASANAAFYSVAAALVVPPALSFALLIVLAIVEVATTEGHDPDVTVDYTQRGTCVASVATHSDGSHEIYSGGDDLGFEHRDPGVRVDTFKATALVGRDVKLQSGESGRVVGVHGGVINANTATVQLRGVAGAAGRRSVSVETLCGLPARADGGR